MSLIVLIIVTHPFPCADIIVGFWESWLWQRHDVSLSGHHGSRWRMRAVVYRDLVS